LEQNGIRRKISKARESIPPVEVSGAAKAWRLAMARAMHYAIGLEMTTTDLQFNRRSLPEILELPPERALIVILEGPKDGLGLLVMSAEVLAGILEMQMVGKVSANVPLSRRPTRTDAAMVSGLIDRALDGLESQLLRSVDLVWASGFRYASFLEDARPLGLLLEDIPYQLLQAEVSMSGGAKTGQIILALPVEGKGRQPRELDTPNPRRASELVFGAALEEQVLGASADLVAVLTRLKLPLDTILNFKVGDPIPLGSAALDKINIEGTNGIRIAGGKLGQNGGMRALRFTGSEKPETQGTFAKPTVTMTPLSTLQTAETIRKAG
jgi:flagellar motor switch protein FliM